MPAPPSLAANRQAPHRAILIVLLASGLFSSGCKNPGGTPWFTAAIGGVVGAVAGGLIDQSGESAALGAAAGALVGGGIGYLIYRNQMHLEAQLAASKARVEQSEEVLKKYRSYNQQLSLFRSNAMHAAQQLTSTNSSARNEKDVSKARAGLVTLIDDATQGGKGSVRTLQQFRQRVELASAAPANPANDATAEATNRLREEQLKRIEELKVEEEFLIKQLDALTGLRAQVSGGG